MRALLASAALGITACAIGQKPGESTILFVRPEPAEPAEPGTPAAPCVPCADGMTPPVKLSGPDPTYTATAFEKRIQGTMIVRCRITVEGSVTGCTVMKGLPYMDHAVVDALQRRRYQPATRDGTPVEVDYHFKINLRLP